MSVSVQQQELTEEQREQSTGKRRGGGEQPNFSFRQNQLRVVEYLRGRLTNIDGPARKKPLSAHVNQEQM